MQISRSSLIKYSIRILIIVIAIGIILASLWAVFILYAFSQLGNEDVRFKNHYYLPKFSYGYLSNPVSDKSATLYTSIDTSTNPLDPKKLDCLEGCNSGRKPYISTRKSDCTRADKKDANDENCASADFQLIKRHDGTKQWAYRGKLLYYYPEKKINGSWWQPDIEDISSQNEKNWRPVQYLYFYKGVLVNSAGKTVYQSKDETNCITSSCSEMERLEVGHEYIFDTSHLASQAMHSGEADKNQWSYQKKSLVVRKADQSSPHQDAEQIPANLEVVNFQPGYAAIPTQKYIEGSSGKELASQKKYLFNYRGQFLTIPTNKNHQPGDCDQECKNYFVPYLVEEDVTQQTTFGDFTARPIGQSKVQWFYKNQPVYILVNSYGWPFLDKLGPYNMRLINP